MGWKTKNKWENCKTGKNQGNDENVEWDEIERENRLEEVKYSEGIGKEEEKTVNSM